jgi:hypothetical protein
VTEADTEDKNVPDLNVAHIVDVRICERIGRGRTFSLSCGMRGKDCEAKINAIDNKSANAQVSQYLRETKARMNGNAPCPAG